MRWLLPCLLYVVILIVAGCSDSDIQQRRQFSLEKMNWHAGSAEDKRIQQLIISSLELADDDSLQKPQLLNVAMRVFHDGSSRGLLGIDWIAAEPMADGIRICLSDGTEQDVAFDEVEITHNEQQAKEQLFYSANPFVERDQPQLWEKLLSDHDATVVLLSEGVPISNEQSIHRVEMP